MEALERVEQGLALERKELGELKKLLEGLEGGDGLSPDARLQQGIDNLMAFDGRPGKREGV